MRNLVASMALMAALVFVSTPAKAGEPNLRALGLGSMTPMTHAEAFAVRGQTRRVSTVSVSGSTYDAKAAGIIVFGSIGGKGGGHGGGEGYNGKGGGPNSGGIQFIGGIGTLSSAQAGYSATGTSNASGWALSQATYLHGSYATSQASAN
ncbi:MAG: hypothetical protein KDB03_08465 [Planctomycetales bacterium]|nr:hypothetical protein [Planctomycetales bacterium]